MAETKKTTAAKTTAPAAQSAAVTKGANATAKAAAAKPATVALNEVKPAAAASKKSAAKQIKVTLVRSVCNGTKVQKRTVEALGLKRPRSFKIHNDNPAIRGMIFRVRHLVAVEEVK